MQHRIKSLLQRIIGVLPRCISVAKLCRLYYDYCYGDNNCNIRTNGENRVLKRYLPGCKIVFDIGANVGVWTQEALRIEPDLRVYCFEPGQSAFSQLQKNYGNDHRVICNNLGMGSEKEKRRLYNCPTSSEKNSLYQRPELLEKKIDSEWVLVDTVDNYCRENAIDYIDLIKIDVEGNELNVLKGMQATLAQEKVGIIKFEYGGTFIDAGILLRDIFQFVNNYHYTFFKILPHKLLPVDKYQQQYENFQYQNWLITKMFNGK